MRCVYIARVQDMVFLGAERLGCTLSQIYKEVPPRRTMDTTEEELFRAPCLEAFDIQHEALLSQQPGGPTAAVLGRLDDNVRLITADIGGTAHGFVYDARFVDDEFPIAKGAIMDLCMGKVRLLHPYDRSSVAMVREAVDSYYGGAQVRVADSWIMRLK